MDVPVFLFTGFLDAGKTRFIGETLSDPKFFERGKDRTLVILCEEGEEELDPAPFGSPDVFTAVIDEPRRINPDKLEALGWRAEVDVEEGLRRTLLIKRGEASSAAAKELER